ncbi:hypothetical protein MKEN_00845300 [Mycena kentingensis (nom. inval.)]|nr:hypothetical protein MKEN_00845300 [Mycena kentingensis (nom. inval.)]
MSAEHVESANGAEADSGVGLSDPSMAHGRRQMLDLVNRLHNTGVQTDIDLPQIAVIGNQSAGKSSLIESISGITLPRAAGTCTRCPTECRLSHSESPWKCIVELRYITDKDGQRLGQARTERFGDPVSDKDDVEERIRRAQRAILNPSKPAKAFLDDDDEGESHELSFSHNYISLQISGPEMADLSFVDLPGLIASASVSRGGNERDIELVNALVALYISKPSCVILLTVACETDFENQGAHRLAKKHDPLGKRTVGVLTKPDRIPGGEEERWIPLIRNEVEPLDNRWFCVKQPSSQELKQGISWSEARQRENTFFSATAPWSSLSALHQKQLRTSNLIGRLSAILSELISKRLPEIQVELDKSVQKTQASLLKLPKQPSSDPVGEVAGMLARFVDELNRVVEGVPNEEGLIQRIRPAQEAFRRAIFETAPEFCPVERRRAKGHSEFHIALEDSFESSSEERTKRTIYVMGAARARELPGNAPFSVQINLIAEFTNQWGDPAHRLCSTVSTILGEHLRSLITTRFAGYGQGGLEQRMRILMQEQLQQRTDVAQALIAKLIALEEPGAMTLNEHYLSDYKAKYLTRFRETRDKAANSAFATNIKNYNSTTYTNNAMSQVLSGLATLGLSKANAADLAKLLPPDETDGTLHIMADVRAYFQGSRLLYLGAHVLQLPLTLPGLVAYKRVVDIVSLAIDHELVRGVARGLLPILYAGLGVGGPDGMRVCRELAQEDEKIAAMREELVNKMERLQGARQELVKIEM